MKVVGIICEYNPFHNGHARQIRWIRDLYGDDCAVVCLMSGNFIQRGQPAIYPKLTRARAALESGADLVLELPVTCVLRSAEGFAAGGVEILGKFCDELCFGSESATADDLTSVARILLSEQYPGILKEELAAGCSFPVARQRAVGRLGGKEEILAQPNHILGVEYCKAMLAGETAMTPLVISRPGDYHASLPDPEHPSATSLRRLAESGKSVQGFVPERAETLFDTAPIHTLQAGERSVLSRLRTMTDAEFEAAPYGSEGLWRKFMAAARRESSLEAIAANVKSKRYTRTRIDRMILCAYLGITQQQLEESPAYVRVLGLTDRGREVLRIARKAIHLPNIGENLDHPHQDLEVRCGDLYALFAQNNPEPGGTERKLRVVYRKTTL